MSPRPTRGKAAKGKGSEPIGLADALFTSTQQRVLALLFGQPARSFFATELIELTGSGSGGTQRELKRLASSDLVTVNRIGNQTHYQANPASPVFGELRGLVTKTVALADPIRRALEPLADHIELALLHGPMVTGTETPTSSIDVLVVTEQVMLESICSALAPVAARLDRRVSPTLYTPVEFEAKTASDHPFLRRVLSDPHVVLMGTNEPPAAR